MKSIVLGGGCFWCIEAVFQRVRGVEKVTSGYAGGDLHDPTYENHGTHAEVVKVDYDENNISLAELLDIFFAVHDPTTVNKQGNDIGTQYRSIILCSNHADTDIARAKITGIRDLWQNPVITEVRLLEKFYPAEDYHQDYFNQNQSAGYCQVVINPKLEKFQKNFANLLK
jgi:methionine-S-sulfoxide reductase